MDVYPQKQTLKEIYVRTTSSRVRLFYSRLVCNDFYHCFIIFIHNESMIDDDDNHVALALYYVFFFIVKYCYAHNDNCTP